MYDDVYEMIAEVISEKLSIPYNNAYDMVIQSPVPSIIETYGDIALHYDIEYWADLLLGYLSTNKH